MKRFAGWKAHEITLTHIENYLDEFEKPATRQGEHTRLQTFISYCKTQGYRRDNPFEKLKQPQVVHGRPVILAVDECKRLMDSAKSDPELIPSFALKLFAGIRPDEVRRLHWRDVKLESGEVVIDTHVAKMPKHIRVVKLPENCLKWLNYKPSCLKNRPNSLIQPVHNYRKRFEAVRRNTADAETDLPEIQWAPDILRHTAASHFFQDKGAAWTASNLGHSERVLFRNYRAQVTDREAAAFYSITP